MHFIIFGNIVRWCFALFSFGIEIKYSQILKNWKYPRSLRFLQGSAIIYWKSS